MSDTQYAPAPSGTRQDDAAASSAPAFTNQTSSTDEQLNYPDSNAPQPASDDTTQPTSDESTQQAAATDDTTDTGPNSADTSPNEPDSSPPSVGRGSGLNDENDTNPSQPTDTSAAPSDNADNTPPSDTSTSPSGDETNTSTSASVSGDDQGASAAVGMHGPISVVPAVTGLLDTGNVTDLVDLGSVTDLVDPSSLLDTAGLDGLTSNLGSVLDVAGTDATLQPVFDASNAAVSDVVSITDGLGADLGLSDTVDGVTGLVHTVGLDAIGADSIAPDGHTNLLTDVLNTPATTLDEGADVALARIGADVTDTTHSASDLINSVTDGVDPVTDLIGSIGNDAQTGPIVAADGGDNGGLLNGTLADLNGSPSGNLVNADVGPQDPQGIGVNVLSGSDNGADHTASISAVDVGPTGPNVADVALLSSMDSINVPVLDNAGADGLVGAVLTPIAQLGDVSAGTDASPTVNAPLTAPIDAEVSGIHDVVTAPINADSDVLNTHGVHII